MSNTNNILKKIKVINILGVTRSFILKDLIKRKGFPLVKKKDPYNLVIIDRSLLLSRDRKVIEETILL